MVAVSVSTGKRIFEIDHIAATEILPLGDALFVATAGIARTEHRILRVSRDGKSVRPIPEYDGQYCTAVATRDRLVVSMSGEPVRAIDASGAVRALSTSTFHVQAAAPDAVYGSADAGVLRMDVEGGATTEVLSSTPRGLTVGGNCLYWIDERRTLHATTR
jgi:hypothetical protein